jgi:type II secretory ATPase GspE/PulE/Tfp pilus assembly ATPase PilB-like protein
MNIKKILTPKQLEICAKEQYFYRNLGIEKSMTQIALEHSFIVKKSKKLDDIELLKEYEFIVKDENKITVDIEVKKLLGQKLVEELSRKFQKKITQHVIPVKEFDAKFKKLLQVDPQKIEKTIKQLNAHDATDMEVSQLFDMVLQYAVKKGASDIHINPYKDFDWLRLRVEGRIEAKYLLSKELASRFSFIVKERANIDLINVQTPQSGGFKKEFEASQVDFRVEIAPANYGENVVIRILSDEKGMKSLQNIFAKTHPMYEYIANYAMQKNGFFLVVGPTGSGKTTTLNAILNKRDRLNEIIYTVEDPIEYKIDFVTQYQINESIGFDFATAVKSVMRQDPDVVVIGEMRDKQSVQIALKAAHSGHMVFSTLHTSTAFMAMERIRDEGGDLFILAYSLSAVIAQRLVPKLCECKEQAQNEKAREFFATNVQGYKRKGCIKCNYTGYDDRVLLTDMVFIPPDLKVRYKFYTALKNSTVLKAWDDFVSFSYFQSAKYLYEEGFCDFETLSNELLSLGYVSENNG